MCYDWMIVVVDHGESSVHHAVQCGCMSSVKVDADTDYVCTSCSAVWMYVLCEG